MNPPPPSSDSDADLDYGPTLRGLRAGWKVFERYTLVRQLGRGGMGVVWLARDEELEREVALKFLPEIISQDEEAIRDLKRETNRCLDLNHPNIVRVYDLLRDGDAAAIAMEYVQGHTLAQLKLRQPEACFDAVTLQSWLEPVCAALSYAHTNRRIVHRDIKPANLMVDEQGVVKIMDFGVARSLRDSASRVSVAGGSTGGTLLYMSPQQATGYDPAVGDDVYSLGAMLYELLTGKPPFYTGNVMHQLENVTAPSMTERRRVLGVEQMPPIPAVWEQTVAACLEKEVEKRPQSVQDVWQRLSGAPVRQSVGESVKALPATVVSSRSRKPVLITLAALLIAGSAAGWWIKVEAPRRAEAARIEQERLEEEERLRLVEEARRKKEADDAAEAARLAKEKADAEEKQKQMAEAARIAKEKADAEEKVKQMAAEAERQRMAEAERKRMAALEEEQKQKDAALVAALNAASQNSPLSNSLGMKFVPAGTPGVLFSVWETRVKDFEAFVEETGHDAVSDNAYGGTAYTLESGGEWKKAGGSWRDPRFPAKQSGEHPVVCVSYLDAEAFCAWLTKKDRAAGKIPATASYRLPTDAEWSRACGSGKYPWGENYPPKSSAGNYCGKEAMVGVYEGFSNPLTKAGYRDSAARTAVVGMFEENRFGLCDMGGNVAEWCSTWYEASMNDADVLKEVPVLKDDGGGQSFRVLRGASWGGDAGAGLRSSCRDVGDPRRRDGSRGFRCVLVVAGG
jgi:formylglycine-generating enzyme required for sulfatase activity